MSQVLTMNVHVNEQAIEAKIDELLDDSTMLAVHNAFARLIDPWVPMLEGPLSQTLEITPEYVRYLVPYAHYQYNGINFNHTTTYHPLASAQWDKVAMQTQMPQFEAEVTEILKRRARELNE